MSKSVSDDNSKDQLRFITCGAVDDGKSTLLGRLLHDADCILDDQLYDVTKDSERYGMHGKNVDLALLVDGLQAEREQGITIDVAYRFFETKKRKFIAADTPGHEQYTRNMATGASTADLAIILVDACQGITEQTKRHSVIVSLMGVRNVVLAINKMDCVDFDSEVFESIRSDYLKFTKKLKPGTVQAIPVSALAGDNVVGQSSRMQWYDGPTLITWLETAEVVDVELPFRMPVQLAHRPTPDLRGYCGTLTGGAVRINDTIVSALSGKHSKLKRIIGPDGDIKIAIKDQAVTLVLEDEIDISRGDVICFEDDKPEVADRFAAHVIWMNENEMLPGRRYLARFSTMTTNVQIIDLVHSVDVNTLDQHAAKTLPLNGVGYCKIAADQDIACDQFSKSPATGCFVLIDKFTNATVGAGMIDFALRRATNIQWHEMKIDKPARALAIGQTPRVLWFTGLSGSGKSSIADIVEQKLQNLGKSTYILDGDNVRHGLNKDLGFTDQDRVENIRRIAEVAKLLTDAGLIVLTSFISPFRSERHMARALLNDGEFIEIFVNTPLEVCEKRDPKGLYKKARAGELANFTGIDSGYEEPQNAELVLQGASLDLETLADQVIEYLLKI